MSRDGDETAVRGPSKGVLDALFGSWGGCGGGSG